MQSAIQFAIKLMDCNKMNSGYSKLTYVTDHSLNNKSDQLINPLRNALLKSEFPLSRVSHFSQLTQQNFTSRLSNKVCRLSPEMAKRIRQTTFLPIQSQLTPTSKLYEVAGKEYTILDVQEKIKHPLTGSQFSKIPLNNFEQIVYQIKDNRNSQVSQSSQHKKKKINRFKQLQRDKDEKTNGLATKQSTPHAQRGQNKTLSNLADQQQNQRGSKVGTPFSNKCSTLTMNNGVQPYKFKQDLLSEGSRIQSKLKKKEYKYNLFSLLDEIGNNGCSAGLSENELCAPRRTHTEWK